MGKKTKSMDKKFKDDGFVLIKSISYKSLPEELCELAIDIGRGGYDSIIIMPSDISMHGEDYIPNENQLFVYAKTTGKREIKSRTAYTLCKNTKEPDSDIKPMIKII